MEAGRALRAVRGAGCSRCWKKIAMAAKEGGDSYSQERKSKGGKLMLQRSDNFESDRVLHARTTFILMPQVGGTAASC